MKRGPTGPTLDNRPTKRSVLWANPHEATIPCAGRAAANRVVKRFTCVKRAAVRDGFDQNTSRRTGFVEVGTFVDALECRTNDSGVVRVRFSGGWLSCTSQKGDTLLQPAVRMPPTCQGCRCCGKLGHLKQNCPHKDVQCYRCGKVRTLFLCTLCSHVLRLENAQSCDVGAQAGHLPSLCAATIIGAVRQTRCGNVEGVKKTTSNHNRRALRPTVEDLDAEMDEYFKDDLAEPERAI